MPEHEVRGERALYDHEIEEPRPGRRRREVADWGVGEEIFDRMPSPRRRFASSTEAPRRQSHPRDAHDEAPQRREDAIRDARDDARATDDAGWGTEPRGDAARELPRREEAPRGDAARELPLRDEAPREERARIVDEAAPVAEPSETGRRTVVIRGQAAGHAPLPTTRRQRPPRSAVERLGPRPDRIAAWAVALGILLIVIAFLSS
jgi:hypothetical protein